MAGRIKLEIIGILADQYFNPENEKFCKGKVCSNENGTARRRKGRKKERRSEEKGMEVNSMRVMS